MPSAPTATQDQPAPAAKSDRGWFQKLRRHAFYPVVLFIVASSIIRENYPFSHFPMYAKPSPKPLSYAYLADGGGEPLSLLHYTGLTPSRLSKLFGKRKAKYEKQGGLNQQEIDHGSGLEVLEYVREMNAKRPTRPLPDAIQLIKVVIDYGDGVFVETPIVAAENP
jgi:hypothetical protein